MTEIFSRKLIEVEIKLGFLNIPKQGIDLMPDEKTSLTVYLDKETKPVNLRYNADYKRIFGLTNWYRKHNAKPKDEVDVKKIKHNPPTYQINLKEAKLIKDEREEQKEAKKLIDLSGLSSIAKGDIVEDRIKELILLHGQGLLNVYRPVSDTEGIDLVVTKSGIFQPIFIQVKGRFNLQKNGALLVDIGKKTLIPHHSFYIIAAYFNPSTLEIDKYILLIPSEEVEKEAIKVKSKYGERRRIATHLNPESKSKWAQYVINKSELSNKLLGKFEEMSKYIK